MRKNALQVLIPKFGLEGTIYLSGKKHLNSSVQFVYCEEEHTQQYNNVVFRAFDPVTIRLSLDTSNVQHEKLIFALVKPYIEGFSVQQLTEQTNADDISASATGGSKAGKRKSDKVAVKETPIPEPPSTKKEKKNKKQKK